MDKLIYYIEFLAAFIAAEAASMWGQYHTLKYPKMGQLEAWMRSMPFAWTSWIFTSTAVYLGDKYDLVTPTQDTFILIISQFVMILLINYFHLKQPITRSDLSCFFIILAGFYISFDHTISKALGIPIPKPKEKTDVKSKSKKKKTKK